MKRTWVLIVFFSLSPLAWATGQESAKDVYLKKTEAELEDWSAKADRLQKQAETANAKTREQLRSELRMVQAKLNAARKKLIRVKKSGEATWEGLRKDADSAVHNVQEAYEKTIADFHKNEHSGEER